MACMLRKGYLASVLEDCFTLNCTLKFICSSQEKKRTLRVKNCLYLDVGMFLQLMTKIVRRYLDIDEIISQPNR